jgi:thiocyanate hydrolase subunit beta
MKMASRPELRQQYELIGSIQPALHVPQNWNYENSAPLFRALMHPPHDVGGQPDAPVYYEEKEEEQWELDTYVTCEVLGWRGVWTAEERRRRADNDLGYTLYLGMPYYGRWIWSAARMLVDKKHVTLTELLDKIAEVKSRHEKNETQKMTNTAARFKVGDRVQVRDMPNMFYTRTQNYVRGVIGTVAARTYQDLIPEDEAFNYDGRQEQYYIVRFRQKDLWEEYPFDNDTLQTEFPDRWLEPART